MHFYTDLTEIISIMSLKTFSLTIIEITVYMQDTTLFLIHTILREIQENIFSFMYIRGRRFHFLLFYYLHLTQQRLHKSTYQAERQPNYSMTAKMTI